MKNRRRSTCDRLGSYLTAAVTVGTLANTADAAIVNLDVSSISGANAGIAPGGQRSNILLSSLGLGAAGLTGDFDLYNRNTGDYTYHGIDIDGGGGFAINGGDASPRNFNAGGTIDGTAEFSGKTVETVFYYSDNGLNSVIAFSPVFGPDSFLGFRSGNNHYGWLEVTWNGTDTFEIISGAFEDQAGVAINAGVSAVPEPMSMLSTMGLLASGLLIRRRKLAA
jgi:hypothetical protein